MGSDRVWDRVVPDSAAKDEVNDQRVQYSTVHFSAVQDRAIQYRVCLTVLLLRAVEPIVVQPVLS